MSATFDPDAPVRPNAHATPLQTEALGEDALAPSAEMPIRLPTFEGPLDLLLFLIRRNEIDIYDIPIESVTRQYLEVIKSMESLNLEVAGDFFVMAATLMYIKSRMLLPTNEQVSQPQEEEEEADPRWELVQQLLEYKKYKEAALEIQILVERQQDFLPRLYEDKTPAEDNRDLEPSDKIDVWNTFNKVLRRLSDRIVRGEIQDEEVSVAQRMEFILDVIQTREQFTFTEILKGGRLTIPYLVSTFLAILELTRLKRLFIIQDAVFGEIECLRRDNPEDEGESEWGDEDPDAEDDAPLPGQSENAAGSSDGNEETYDDPDNEDDESDDADWNAQYASRSDNGDSADGEESNSEDADDGEEADDSADEAEDTDEESDDDDLDWEELDDEDDEDWDDDESDDADDDDETDEDDESDDADDNADDDQDEGGSRRQE